MRNLTKRLIVLLSLTLILSLTFAGSVVAQDDDELLDYIFEALTQINQQSSVQLSTEQVIAMEMNIGLPLTINMTSNIDAAVIYEDGEVIAMQGISSQMTELPELGLGDLLPNTDATVEVIQVDDETYFRIIEGGNMLGTAVPEGWITADEFFNFGIPVTLNDDFIDFTDFGDMDDMSSDMTTEFIDSITELDNEELNGVDVRVFAIELNLDMLLESELFAEALGSVGLEDAGLDDAGLGDLGMDFETMMGDLLENLTFSVIVRIGADDNLPYQTEVVVMMDADIDMMGQAVNMVIDMTQTTTYSDYNEPVEITAPDLD